MKYLVSFFVFVQLFSGLPAAASEICKGLLREGEAALAPALTNGLIEIPTNEFKAQGQLPMYAAGEQYLVAKKVRYELNGLSGLKLEEHMVSPTEILSLQTKKVVFSS